MPRHATVLVYNPDGPEPYAELIRAPRGRVAIRVARTSEEALPLVGDIDVLYAWGFPRSLYPPAKRLRWIHAQAAGVEWALVPELPAQVVVTRSPGVFGPWMAEYVAAWLLWVTQRTEAYRAAQRRREWNDRVVPDRLAGQTLVVIGLGDIGRAIARTAGGLGLRVVGVSRGGRRVPGIDRVFRVRDLHRALALADFAVVVLPLTAATRGLIGARALAALRPHAWLVNVGRGALIDEPALVAALRERRVGGAVLDVFASEPLPADHPLWGLDNAVVTPHISGANRPAELAPLFNDNLARWLTGRRLRHVVDRARGY